VSACLWYCCCINFGVGDLLSERWNRKRKQRIEKRKGKKGNKFIKKRGRRSVNEESGEHRSDVRRKRNSIKPM
jgi:hypothetical protein